MLTENEMQGKCEYLLSFNLQKEMQITRSDAGVQPRWIQGIRRVDGVGVERLVYLLM